MPHRSWKSLFSRRLVAGILLLGVGVALGFLLAGRGYRRQGLLVWFGDRPYIDAARLHDRERTAMPRPAWDGQFTPEADATMPPDGVGTIASPAPKPPPARVLRLRETVKTAIPPCRAAMEDGTRIYLDQLSAVAHNCPGELTLLQGAIYAEVVPPQTADGDPSAVAFAINYPGGELTTRGAKLYLCTTGQSTRLLVLQGKVNVGDALVLPYRQIEIRSDKSVPPESRIVAQPLDAIAWARGLMGRVPQSQSERKQAGPPLLPGEGRGEGKVLSTDHSPPGKALTPCPSPGGRGETENPGPSPPVPSPIVQQTTSGRAESLEHQRHDWIFLFESSADRDPITARTQVEVIRTILDFSDESDTLTVLSAGTCVRMLSPFRRMVQAEDKAQAIRFLERTHLVGALDLERALTAIEPFARTAKNPVIVHAGSGVPVLGCRDVATLVQKIPKQARYVGVGVGPGVGPWMQTAAAGTDGCSVRIESGSDVRWRTMELILAIDGHPTGPEAMAGDLPQPGASPPRGGRFAAALVRSMQTWLPPSAAAWPRRALARLWRWAGDLAERQGRTLRASLCRGRALELQYTAPVAAGELPALRADYGRLLETYRTLATAVVTEPGNVPREWTVRLIETADRWRAIDPEPEPACQAAAQAFAALALTDLAREYATTPAAIGAGTRRVPSANYGTRRVPTTLGAGN